MFQESKAVKGKRVMTSANPGREFQRSQRLANVTISAIVVVVGVTLFFMAMDFIGW